VTATSALLAFATVLVVVGAVLIFLRDFGNDTRSRARVVVEAAVPLVGVIALVWWSWSAL
jgi:arginine exporter protein ArgO